VAATTGGAAVLAEYVVAHSEVSSPLARRSLIAALIASESGQPVPAVPFNVTAPGRGARQWRGPGRGQRYDQRQSTARTLGWVSWPPRCAVLADDPRPGSSAWNGAREPQLPGTFVHELDGQTETLTIVHRVNGNEIAEDRLARWLGPRSHPPTTGN